MKYFGASLSQPSAEGRVVYEALDRCGGRSNEIADAREVGIAQLGRLRGELGCFLGTAERRAETLER